jgi:O-antigen/teichoic acid export membrane protein
VNSRQHGYNFRQDNSAAIFNEARLKPSGSSFRKLIAEALTTLTTREGLKKIISTPLYRNALYLMSDTAATSLLGFFFWMAVARFYSETEVGLGSAAISAVNLLSILSAVGLSFSIIRFLSKSARPRGLINSSFVLSGLISLAAAAVFLAGVDFWSPALSFVRHNVIFCLAFVIVTILTTLSNLIDSVFVAKRSAGFVLSKNAVFAGLKILLVIVLAFFFRTFGVFASWGIALGVACLISLFLFLPRVEAGYKPVPVLDMGQFRGTWRYSASNYLASLLGKAPNVVLPLMVVNLLGTQSNAYFYIAWMIASFLFTIPGSISRSLFAEGSHSGENLGEQVASSIKFNFLLLVPAVIVMLVIARWILLLFGPGYSTNGLTLLWLLILASLPRGLNNVYIGLLRVQDRLTELLLIRGFITIATLVLSFFFMKSYGMMAVGYVWLGVQLAVAIAVAFRLSRQPGRFGHAEGSDWEDGNHF